MEYIQTVHGEIEPAALGVTLMHEHLVTDLRPEWARIPPTPPLADALDGIGDAPDDGQYVRWIAGLAEAGYLGRVLISQDACAYIVGPDGVATQQRRFGHLITTFVPALLAAGFTQAE